MQKLLFRKWGLKIWHEDACLDGDYDSCGFIYIHLTEDEKELLTNLARDNYTYYKDFDLFKTIYNIYVNIHYEYTDSLKLRSKDLDLVISLSYYEPDDLSYLYNKYIEEYETNKSSMTSAFLDLYLAVGRQYLTLHRKWWKHPLFHFNHLRMRFNYGKD